MPGSRFNIASHHTLTHTLTPTHTSHAQTLTPATPRYTHAIRSACIGVRTSQQKGAEVKCRPSNTSPYARYTQQLSHAWGCELASKRRRIKMSSHQNLAIRTLYTAVGACIGVRISQQKGAEFKCRPSNTSPYARFTQQLAHA